MLASVIGFGNDQAVQDWGTPPAFLTWQLRSESRQLAVKIPGGQLPWCRAIQVRKWDVAASAARKPRGPTWTIQVTELSKFHCKKYYKSSSHLPRAVRLGGLRQQEANKRQTSHLRRTKRLPSGSTQLGKAGKAVSEMLADPSKLPERTHPFRRSVWESRWSPLGWAQEGPPPHLQLTGGYCTARSQASALSSDCRGSRSQPQHRSTRA